MCTAFAGLFAATAAHETCSVASQPVKWLNHGAFSVPLRRYCVAPQGCYDDSHCSNPTPYCVKRASLDTTTSLRWTCEVSGSQDCLHMQCVCITQAAKEPARLFGQTPACFLIPLPIKHGSMPSQMCKEDHHCANPTPKCKDYTCVVGGGPLCLLSTFAWEWNNSPLGNLRFLFR